MNSKRQELFATFSVSRLSDWCGGDSSRQHRMALIIVQSRVSVESLVTTLLVEQAIRLWAAQMHNLLTHWLSVEGILMVCRYFFSLGRRSNWLIDDGTLLLHFFFQNTQIIILRSAASQFRKQQWQYHTQRHVHVLLSVRSCEDSALIRNRKTTSDNVELRSKTRVDWQLFDWSIERYHLQRHVLL